MLNRDFFRILIRIVGVYLFITLIFGALPKEMIKLHTEIIKPQEEMAFLRKEMINLHTEIIKPLQEMDNLRIEMEFLHAEMENL